MEYEEKKLIKYCENLDFKKLDNWPPEEYCYEYISLCAVDAVFSINTNYGAVKNIIGKIKGNSHLKSLEDFKNWLDGHSLENLKEYFNKQKIASKTKIDVLRDFVDVLLESGFLEKSDFSKFINDQKFKSKLKEIRGIGDVTISKSLNTLTVYNTGSCIDNSVTAQCLIFKDVNSNP